MSEKMRDKVYIKDIINLLQPDVIYEGQHDYVRWVVASGLMSDVLTIEEEEILLISNLKTGQVIRTADIVSANAVLYTNGKHLSPEVVSLARQVDITVLSTPQPVFEVCARLSGLFMKKQD